MLNLPIMNTQNNNNNHVGSTETENKTGICAAASLQTMTSQSCSLSPGERVCARPEGLRGNSATKFAANSPHEDTRVNRKSSIGNIPRRPRGKVAGLPKVVR